MDLLSWTGIFKAVGSLFKPVAKVIDDVHVSEEERLNAKATLTATQANVALKWMEMEGKLADLQGKIVQAEMQHGNWLSRSWRPIVMLTFLGLIVSYWFGYIPPNVTENTINVVFEIIKWGLGGYVIGRSAEKTIPKIIGAMKNPEG